MYADRWLVENCCITKTYLNGTRNSDGVTLPCLFDAASGKGSQPQRTLVEVFSLRTCQPLSCTGSNRLCLRRSRVERFNELMQALYRLAAVVNNINTSQ